MCVNDVTIHDCLIERERKRERDEGGSKRVHHRFSEKWMEGIVTAQSADTLFYLVSFFLLSSDSTSKPGMQVEHS